MLLFFKGGFLMLRSELEKKLNDGKMCVLVYKFFCFKNKKSYITVQCIVYGLSMSRFDVFMYYPRSHKHYTDSYILTLRKNTTFEQSIYNAINSNYMINYNHKMKISSFFNSLPEHELFNHYLKTFGV